MIINIVKIFSVTLTAALIFILIILGIDNVFSKAHQFDKNEKIEKLQIEWSKYYQEHNDDYYLFIRQSKITEMYFDYMMRTGDTTVREFATQSFQIADSLKKSFEIKNDQIDSINREIVKLEDK